MTPFIKDLSSSEEQKIAVTTTEGIELIGTFYEGKGNKGVFLLPGFTEHRSSLEEMAQSIQKADCHVWTFDINGQGESGGSWNLTEMIKSVTEIERTIKKRYGVTKLGAYGNSIGGMAVGIAATEDSSDIDCLCLVGCPTALQDVVAPWQRALLRNVSQAVLRYGTIIFDGVVALMNENYRNLTHRQFTEDGNYKPYAQFGAMKIPDIGKVIEDIENAPRLDDAVEKLTQPVLYVYGGEDKVIGVTKGILPEKIQRMTVKTRNKECIVVEGADHSLNTKTKIEDHFNQDPQYAWVREHIVRHFMNYIL